MNRACMIVVCPSVQDTTGAPPQLPSLTELTLKFLPLLSGVVDLSSCTLLRTAAMQGCQQLEVAGLAGLGNLIALQLGVKMAELPDLGRCSNLQYLAVGWFPRRRVYGPMPGLCGAAWSDDRIEPKKPKKEKPQKAPVTIFLVKTEDEYQYDNHGAQRRDGPVTTQITELPDLSHLSHLQELQLSGCSNLRSVTNLTGLTTLTRLVVRGCDALSSQVPLCSSLRDLDVYECPNLPFLGDRDQLPETLQSCVYLGANGVNVIFGVDDGTVLYGYSSC
jgi:internalin A